MRLNLAGETFLALLRATSNKNAREADDAYTDSFPPYAIVAPSVVAIAIGHFTPLVA
jgi:hypothetical protein